MVKCIKSDNATFLDPRGLRQISLLMHDIATGPDELLFNDKTVQYLCVLVTEEQDEYALRLCSLCQPPVRLHYIVQF